MILHEENSSRFCKYISYIWASIAFNAVISSSFLVNIHNILRETTERERARGAWEYSDNEDVNKQAQLNFRHASLIS